MDRSYARTIPGEQKRISKLIKDACDFVRGSPRGINSGGIFLRVRRRWEMVCAMRNQHVPGPKMAVQLKSAKGSIAGAAHTGLFLLLCAS